MVSRRFVLVPFLVLALCQQASASYLLTAAQKEVISAWLTQHPKYRLANDRDCACESDLRTIRTAGDGGRWKPVPHYHPYAVTGDFNGDGEIDFAVAVIRIDAIRKFTILVFNGPIRSAAVAPSFVDRDVDLTHVGFFYGSPRPRPYRLVLGEFQSEGLILIPMGATYRWESQSSENE